MRLERSYYHALIAGAATEGILLIRLNDGAVGKLPFDIYGVTLTGRAVAVEVKVCRTVACPTSLPENLFEKHQLNYLREFAHRGAVSLGIVYHDKVKRMMVWDFQLEHWVGDLHKTTMRGVEAWVDWPKSN